MWEHFLLQVLLSFPKCIEALKKNFFPPPSSPPPPQALVSLVNSFHEKIVALEDKTSPLEQSGNDASKAAISRSMATVWQRWARLRAVAQDQEKILEDAVNEWTNFNDKVTSVIGGLTLWSPRSGRRTSKSSVFIFLVHLASWQ